MKNWDTFFLNVKESKDIEPPRERLKTERDMYSIPAIERAAAAERIKAKTAAAKAKREKQRQDSDIKEEKKGMSKDEMLSVLKGHKYTKPQLLDMSKKSTKEGRHGEAAALYHEFQKEDTQIGEDKEYRREMAKAAARERAEERREKGSKAAKSPGREGPSAGKSYADYQEISIKAHDKLTKKNKNIVGLVSKEEVELDEMAVSKAQQRFFGVVRAEQEGKMKGASPEIKAAAKSMTKKQAHDFAATKHAGLPEKKETKEELSLVDKIIAEFGLYSEDSTPQQMAASARRQSAQQKQQKRLKTAKTSVAGSQALKGDSEKSSQPTQSTASTPRGKSGKTAFERGSAIVAAGRVKSKSIEAKGKLAVEKEKTARQEAGRQERQTARQEREAAKIKRIESAKKATAERQKEQTKKRTQESDISKRKESIQKLTQKQPNFQTVGHNETLGSAGQKVAHNLGQVTAGVGRAAVAGVKIARLHKKQKEYNKQDMQSESLYNWRKDFIFEVDDSVMNNSGEQKIVDVMSPKKKNTIIIDPKIQESVKKDNKSDDNVKKEILKKVIQVVGDEKKRKNYLLTIGNIGTVEESSTPAWQRKEGKNPEGGLNKKGIASYRKEHPGSHLSLAVTTPPSKLDPDSKAAKRRKSFCARMSGMPGPMKDEKGRPTRKALSLRKWNCN